MDGYGTSRRVFNFWALIAACAMLTAMICMFLPLLSVEFFGTRTFNVTEVIEMGNDEIRTYMMLCMLLGFAGTAFAGFANLQPKLLIPTIVMAGLNVSCMLVALSDDLDYLGYGFYLFVMMNVLAVAMSIVGLQKPAYREEIKPRTTTCVNCGNTLAVGATFCGTCGTVVGKTVAPPVPVSPAQVSCPNCHTSQANVNGFCVVCGSSLNGYPPVSPVGYVPGPGSKGERKAICPHCGARQTMDVVRCKYCGTSMR